MLIIDMNEYNSYGIQVSGNHIGVLSEGKALAKANIIHRGNRTHIWHVDIKSEEGRLLSSIRVTNMILKEMRDSENLPLFINKLLAKNCPFALWSAPGSKSPEILISSRENIVCSTQSDHLNNLDGFVFAPYENREESPAILIRPGIYKKGAQDILKIDLDAIPQQPEELNRMPVLLFHRKILAEAEEPSVK